MKNSEIVFENEGLVSQYFHYVTGQLTGSILSKRMAEDLQKLNPFLSRDAIDSIRTMAVGALLRAPT